MDTTTAALLFAGGFLFFALIIGLVWYILQVVASWKIFQKFGEPGWKAIIPFYNSYILFKYTWNTSAFILYLALGALVGIAKIFEVSGILGLLVSVAGLAVAVIYVMSMHKLSRAFGHGVGFTLGLVLLNNIFMLILGFGSSRYMYEQESYMDFS